MESYIQFWWWDPVRFSIFHAVSTFLVESILCCWLVCFVYLFVPRNQTNCCAPTEMQHFKWTVRVLCEQAANFCGLRATNPLIQYIELTFSPVLFLHLLLFWCHFFFLLIPYTQVQMKTTALRAWSSALFYSQLKSLMRCEKVQNV